MNSRIVDGWKQSTVERANAALTLARLYQLQADFLFSQFEPVKSFSAGSVADFNTRLELWLSSFDSDEDQWCAFRSLRYFAFFGQTEIEELYRCAVHNQLLPWLVDRAGIDIFAADYETKLDDEVAACWPCPVTDSLRINGLLHCTGLSGQTLRPDWLSLKELGAPEAIKRYVLKHNVKYLVLVEDFVGSGQQCERAVKFALSAFDGPIFLIPLIVCQPGFDRLAALAERSNGYLHFRHGVKLDANCLVGATGSVGEPNIFAELRQTIQRGYAKGKFLDSTHGGPYGWKDVGSLVCTYSNCPNNTPPIFHGRTETWPAPIFPRLSRT